MGAGYREHTFTRRFTPVGMRCCVGRGGRVWRWPCICERCVHAYVRVSAVLTERRDGGRDSIPQPASSSPQPASSSLPSSGAPTYAEPNASLPPPLPVPCSTHAEPAPLSPPPLPSPPSPPLAPPPPPPALPGPPRRMLPVLCSPRLPICCRVFRASAGPTTLTTPRRMLPVPCSAGPATLGRPLTKPGCPSPQGPSPQGPWPQGPWPLVCATSARLSAICATSASCRCVVGASAALPLKVTICRSHARPEFRAMGYGYRVRARAGGGGWLADCGQRVSTDATLYRHDPNPNCHPNPNTDSTPNRIQLSSSPPLISPTPPPIVMPPSHRNLPPAT